MPNLIETAMISATVLLVLSLCTASHTVQQETARKSSVKIIMRTTSASKMKGNFVGAQRKINST